jgi:hypothetical protein
LIVPTITRRQGHIPPTTAHQASSDILAPSMP